ncbi:hypothetical protein [Nostoc phage NMeng1]|nr:hypothetical protein [Nostoc phage NMeng1]
MHDIMDIIKANENPEGYRSGRDAATGARLGRIPPSTAVPAFSTPLHVFWRGINYVSGVHGAVSVSKTYRTTISLPANSIVLESPQKFGPGLARLAQNIELGTTVYSHCEVLFCIEGGIIHPFIPCTDDSLSSLYEDNESNAA